jgi:ATP-dependent Clp protease ATP-binding subunit ClpC
VQERVREKNIEITLDKKAKDFLIDKGFDKVFGARPLKRTIQRYLENPLAEEILAGSFKEGAKIIVTYSKGKDELEFTKSSGKSVTKKS